MAELEKKKNKLYQSDISQFFKKQKVSTPENPDQQSESLNESTIDSATSTSVVHEKDASSSTASGIITAASNDIGFAVGRKLTAEDRQNFLVPWKPSLESEMPLSMHMKSGVNRCRRLLLSHLINFPWLAVSKVPGQIGAFCVPCVLFSTSGVGGRSSGFGQIPGKLVTKPLNRFDDLTGKNGTLTRHQGNEYHKTNVANMMSFKENVSGANDICSKISSARSEEIKHNREILRPIIDTLLTCARQNIALRGHRGESQRLDAEGKDGEENDGNFRALLRYRIRAGDSNLKNHIEKHKHNASYLSADIQNALLGVAGGLVQESVVDNIKKARFWSIIADETMDRQKREQLAIAIRYVLPDNAGKWHCYEEPVIILDLYKEIETDESQEKRPTGEAIGHVLLEKTKQLGLDLNFCVGQGYDGASAMASSRVGAAAVFKQQAPNAEYFHCAMHSLNLSASKAISVTEIQHAQDIIKETTACFKQSAKRMSLLKSCIADSHKKTLVNLCETRFVERHESIMIFTTLLPYILHALEKMKTWTSCETRKLALRLESSLCNGSFIIALVILETLSGLLLPLTRILQSESHDISQAMRQVSGLIEVVQNLRSESEFTRLFQQASDLAGELGIEILRPRAAQRSVYRKNAGISSTTLTTEDYFRINMFYPAVDAVLEDLKHRFGKRQQTLTAISCLIPSNMDFGVGAKKEEQWKSLLTVLETCGCLQVFGADLHGELDLWRNRWQNSKDLPKSALASLDSCCGYFPNIKILLQVLATLPVTTAEAERVFSRMERTLTAIRASMAENRVQDLLLLQINRQHTPSIDQVIDKFAATSARRLKFLL